LGKSAIWLNPLSLPPISKWYLPSTYAGCDQHFSNKNVAFGQHFFVKTVGYRHHVFQKSISLASKIDANSKQMVKYIQEKWYF